MHHDVRIFALNYQIPSMINFYTRPALEAVCLNLGTYHPTAFDFWYEDRAFIGQDFYFVTEGEPPGAVLRTPLRPRQKDRGVRFLSRPRGSRPLRAVFLPRLPGAGRRVK